jgi:carbon storage regulator
MLILSRKAGDSVMIDGGVRIVVLGVEGSSVRLGIDAPADVRVLRGEIVKQVERENERARVSLASRAAEA